MSRQINHKKEAFFASVGPWSAGIAVPYAGISTPNPEKGSTDSQSEISSPEPYAPLVGISPACRVTTPKNYAPLENGPQSRLHNFRVGAAGPINLRPVFSDIGTAQALKSGNSSTGGVNTIPAVPIFDFPTTLYAAVLRSVPSADRPDGKNGLYGWAETSAPRSGFICFKTTAAQLMAMRFRQRILRFRSCVTTLFDSPGSHPFSHTWSRPIREQP